VTNLVKKYPDEIAQIDREARELAMQKRNSMIVASDAQLVHASFELQHQAAGMMDDVLRELQQIALRQPLSVIVGQNKDGSDRVKVLLPNARDAVAAASLLCSIARDG
jgi:hypothetical protein